MADFGGSGCTNLGTLFTLGLSWMACEVLLNSLGEGNPEGFFCWESNVGLGVL